MAEKSVPAALEGLHLSKTKELKGVRERSAAPYLRFAKSYPFQTEKRDALIAIEKKYQQKWDEDGVFKPDAPSTSEIPLHSISAAELRERFPKYFGTIAYPYMFGTTSPQM